MASKESVSRALRPSSSSAQARSDSPGFSQPARAVRGSSFWPAIRTSARPALKLGADEVIDESEAGTARMEELISIRAIDVAVETVGARGEALIQAQRAVRPKGRVLVLGVFTVPSLTIDARRLSGPEIEIIGSMVYSANDGRSDYHVALEIIADNVEAARSLVTHRFGLDDVQTAFETALDKSTQSIKVHLKPM